MPNPAKICNKIIEYSFYALFFLVPLFFSGSTFELFEFNKMWLVFALTTIILSAWVIKMIYTKEVRIQRTPLDLPILLFLFFQGIATVISLDPHMSFWGYYSRFNGGFLSIISYILLYYAFVSNLLETEPTKDKEHTVKGKNERLMHGVIAFGIMLVGFISSVQFSGEDAISQFIKSALSCISVLTGFFLFIKALPFQNIPLRVLSMGILGATVVALWGFPSHFGYDPTCLQFRGSFDVSCWTDQFQPKVRIFSMLGQPNWLAAYLATLLPLIIAFFLQYFSSQKESFSSMVKKNFLLFATLSLLIALFFADIIFTDSQSGFIGTIISLVVFCVLFLTVVIKKPPIRSLGFVLGLLLLIFFLTGSPIEKLRPFTLPSLISKLQTQQPKVVNQQTTGPALEYNITSSGKIRAIVWKGALNIWEDNKFFGTGVETFALAYFKYKPIGHNTTSEWDYLYNKAHNEYLNYLATTGALGLGTYLLMIGTFLFLCVKRISNFKFKMSNIKQEKENIGNLILLIGLVSGYIAILITNFFGFSVVLLNLLLFLIPAFFFAISNNLSRDNAFVFPAAKATKNATVVPLGIRAQSGIIIVSFIALFLLYTLYQYREADKAYALGNNYDKVNQYQEARPLLEKAVSLRNDEPVFKDELSINLAANAVLEAYSKDATKAAMFAKQAGELSNEVLAEYPQNVTFWKTRVRLFYTLSQIEPEYLQFALDAIEKSHELAPTDAKILYNLGVLEGQTGNPEKAIKTLTKTVSYKPDYRDAYFALALFYHDLEMEAKAIDTLHYILNNINKKDQQVLDTLKTWGEK